VDEFLGFVDLSSLKSVTYSTGCLQSILSFIYTIITCPFTSIQGNNILKLMNPVAAKQMIEKPDEFREEARKTIE